MLGLPSAEHRERILKTLLGKEKIEGLDFKELATMTEGYSGSDLKVIAYSLFGIGCIIGSLLTVLWLFETELVHHSCLSACQGVDTTRKIKGFGKCFFFRLFNFSNASWNENFLTSHTFKRMLKTNFKFLFFPNLGLFAGEKTKS